MLEAAIAIPSISSMLELFKSIWTWMVGPEEIVPQCCCDSLPSTVTVEYDEFPASVKAPRVVQCAMCLATSTIPGPGANWTAFTVAGYPGHLYCPQCGPTGTVDSPEWIRRLARVSRWESLLLNASKN